MDAVSPAPAKPHAADDGHRYRMAMATLPVTNVPLARQTLLDLLTSLRKAPLPAADHLAVLELARAPLAFLQGEAARRYGTQPLPPNEGEIQAFEQVLELWRLMAAAYGQVAHLGGNDAAVQSQLALICQRCIHYAGRAITEHFRARREVAPGLWHDLHGYYDTAEDWGYATTEVAEPLGRGKKVATATSTYAAVLLADLANPYSRTPKELAWVLEWAERFAPFTAVVVPDAEAGGRGFGIDLMQDRGTLPVETLDDRPSARLFDTSRLSRRMRKILNRLKEGETPASLGLGKDCTAAQAGRLVVQLYRPWCLAAHPRRFERIRARGELAMAYGFEAIHYYVSEREFIQPAHVRTFSRAEMDALWTFRNQLDPTQPLHVRTARLGFTLDQWEIADRSMNGFRAFRAWAGPRVEHSQLLALRPDGGEFFLLGQVSWLMLENDRRLHAGIHVLPGRPQAVCIRPVGASVAPSTKYVRAFLLPEVAVLKEPTTVILPSGWFQPERIIDLYTDRSLQVRLTRLVGHGANFERCTFSLVSAGE